MYNHEQENQQHPGANLLEAVPNKDKEGPSGKNLKNFYVNKNVYKDVVTNP